jgi:ATP-dependent DNA helicase DinG
MRYCAEQLRYTFEARGWKLLVQGIDGQRSQILSDFRNDVNSVLFGTDSFWTGVDVPGEALSNVIVTKLPFAVPSHPLIAARMREIEKSGRSSFSEYSLPEAVLKFRQGAGRLIRSRQDTGVIVVLDHRVVSKGYGRLFLDALPYQVVLE